MRKIIKAGDDDSFRRMLGLTLRRLGAEVREAVDGMKAIGLHREDPADLLITLMMPEKEGLETILEFRRRYHAVKIIAMSGGRINPWDFLGIAQRFGANRGLAKPFSTLELTAAIEAIFEIPRSRIAPSNKCIALGKGCGAEPTNND